MSIYESVIAKGRCTDAIATIWNSAWEKIGQNEGEYRKFRIKKWDSSYYNYSLIQQASAILVTYAPSPLDWH